MGKTYQITETELQALLKEQRIICAQNACLTSNNGRPPVINRVGILNAPLPYLSHLKEAGHTEAVEFGNFLLKNNMRPTGFGGWGGGKINTNYYGSSSEELYQLFNQS